MTIFREVVMRKVFMCLSIALFVFICWVIYAADTGFKSGIFQWVKLLPYGDKLCHFGLYAVLALLLNLALGSSCFRWVMPFRIADKAAGVSFACGSSLVFSFSVLEEFSQFYFPARTPDLWDLVANFLGVVVAAWVPNRWGGSVAGSKVAV